MKKFPANKILKATLIIGALNVVILPPILTSPLITWNSYNNEDITLAIKAENDKLKSQIQKLEENKQSIDTLQANILETKKIIAEAEKVLLEYDKENLRDEPEINQALDVLIQNITALKNKQVENENVLEQKKQHLNNVVAIAEQAVKKAEEKVNITLSIDLDGLNAANEELKIASNEIKKAQELTKISKEHSDKLVALAQRVDDAALKVNNLIQELSEISKDNNKLNAKYKEEINKLNNLILLNINESKRDNLDLEQIQTIVNTLTKLNQQAKRANEIINENQDTNDEVGQKNNDLVDLVLQSEQVIEELNAKVAELKGDINNQLTNLSKVIKNTSSNIDSSNNLSILDAEFNNTQNRISRDFKGSKDKIQKFKYVNVLNQLVDLEKLDNENMTKALNKAKLLVKETLTQATDLNQQQRDKYQANIDNATNIKQLQEMRKAIILANEKEKSKKEINLLSLISDDEKRRINQLIQDQQSDQQIEQIIESTNQLNDKKEVAKETISNFENFSNQILNNYIDTIINATTIEQITKLLKDASELQSYKQQKENDIETLENLSNTDKNNLFEEIKNTDSKDVVDSIIQKAKNLDTNKQEAFKTVNQLNELSVEEQEQFKVKINNGLNKEIVDKLIQDAKSLNNNRKDAKSFINNLENLSSSYKEELKEDVALAASTEMVNKIKNQATKFNNEKKMLIDEINKLTNFEPDKLKKFVEEIKNNYNLEDAKQFKIELKEISDLKQQVFLLIDQSNNKLDENKKNTLKDELTKAITKEDVEKVKQNLELEKKKLEIVEKIKTLSNVNEEKQKEFIQQVENAKDSDEVDSIIETAQNNLIAAAKAKNKSSVNQMGFISKQEKEKFITSLNNLTNENKQSYEANLEKLKQKNKEKETLYNQIIVDPDLLSSSLQRKIKTQIINENEKSEYDKLARNFIALINTKKQIKEKINTNLDLLGDKDKQILLQKLKEKEDITSVNEIEKQAEALNGFKKSLVSAIEKLEHISLEEKAQAKSKIKDLSTKSQAQKIFDDLRNKSEKEEAKKEINALSSIDTNKAKYIEKINSASNSTEILKIINRAKKESELNKAKNNAKNEINTFSLISNEHKKILNEEIDASHDLSEINKTLNQAKSLQEFKVEYSFDKLNLVEVSKNQNARTQFNELLLKATTKKEVNDLVNQLKTKDQEIINANKIINNLSNISNDIKNQFKERISKVLKNQIDDIVLEAENLNAKNTQNIHTLNNLELLSETYKITKANEIRQQSTLTNSDSKLKEAYDLNLAKQNVIKEINANNWLTANQKTNLNNKVLAANNSSFDFVKQEQNQLATSNKEQILAKIDSNKDYLTNNEVTNLTTLIKNAKTIIQANSAFKKLENLNNNKKRYATNIGKLDLVTENSKSNAIKHIKEHDGANSARQQFNSLYKINKLKQERLYSINNTQAITSVGRTALYKELREHDDTSTLNRILEDILSWQQSTDKNINLIASLNQAKDLINGFVLENEQTMKKDFEAFKSFIVQNTKSDTDALQNLLNKNNAINTQINGQFNKFNDNIADMFEKVKIISSDESTLTNKTKLIEIKEKLESNLEKYKSIKRIIDNRFATRIDQYGYNKVITKANESKLWLEEKVQIIEKHNDLKNKITQARISQNDKQKWNKQLSDLIIKKDSSLQQIQELEKQINENISKDKLITDAYFDSKFELEKTIAILNKYDSISKYRDIEASHQSIVQKYLNITASIHAQYEDYFNSRKLEELTSKMSLAKQNLDTYVNNFKEIEKYISQKSGTNDIKDAAWNKYIEMTQDVRIKLVNNSINDDSYIKEQIKSDLNKAFDEIKKLVFKKQIIQFIGNGKWSQPGGVWNNTHIETIITNAYVQNPETKRNATMHLIKNKGYVSTYPNMKIDFNINDVTRSYVQGYDVWAHEIFFHSSDNDRIVYKLISKKSPGHTWFRINKVPSSDQYDPKFEPWAYQPDTNPNNWFTEQDLILTEYKGQKV